MSGYAIATESVDGVEIAAVTMPGAASFDTITALLRELEAMRPARVLIDESGLWPGPISPAHIQEIAHQWRRATALSEARIAVVAPNLAIYALNRMFQGWAGAEDRVAVFHARADATAWLLR